MDAGRTDPSRRHATLTGRSASGRSTATACPAHDHDLRARLPGPARPETPRAALRPFRPRRGFAAGRVPRRTSETVAEKTFDATATEAVDGQQFRECGSRRWPQALIVQVGADSLGLEEAVALAPGRRRAAGSRRPAGRRRPPAPRDGTATKAWTPWCSPPAGRRSSASSARPSPGRSPGPLGPHGRDARALRRLAGGRILREGAPLARFAPGPIQGVMSLAADRRAGGISPKSQNPIPRAGRTGPECRAARLSGVQGKIEAARGRPAAGGPHAARASARSSSSPPTWTGRR